MAVSKSKKPTDMDLFLACDGEKEDINLVKQCLEAKCDVNYKTSFGGYTPTHEAAARGHLATLKLLLEHRANLLVQNEYMELPLHLAVNNDRLPIVQYMVQEHKIDLCLRGGSYHNQALHYAAIRGHLALVEYLVNNKADISAQTKHYNLPLHLAAIEGRLPVVQFLVQRKADILAKGEGSKTALQWAREKKHEHVVVFLEQAEQARALQASKNAVAKQLRASDMDLYLACSSDKEQIEKVQQCIEAKCDVNYKTSFGGYTPLHEAAMHGFLPTIRLLLEHKADISATNDFEDQAIHMATRTGAVESSGKIARKKEDSAYSGVVEYLVQHKADIHARNRDKDQPIHLAARYGNIIVVRYLLEKKADILSKGEKGKTPLEWARERDQNHVIQFLEKLMGQAESQQGYVAEPLEMMRQNSEERKAEELKNSIEEKQRQLVKLRHVLHKYEIDPTELDFREKIGEGHFSQNYRAVYKSQQVVVKKYKSSSAQRHLVERQPELSLMSLTEQMEEVANLAGMDDHDNLVKFIGYCFGETPTELIGQNEVWVVSEFAEYGAVEFYTEIRNVRDRGKFLHPDCVAWICVEVARGVEYLHHRKTVHRDLALRNLLINNKGRVLVTDLGLARTTAKGYYHSSEGKEIPILQAPEFIGKSTFQTDIWHLGATYLELLLGRVLDSSESHELPASLDTLLKPIQPSPPPVLLELLPRLLARQPEQRPSAAEVVTLLTPITPKVSPLLQALGVSAPSLPQSSSAPSSPSPQDQRPVGEWSNEEVKHWCQNYLNGKYSKELLAILGMLDGVEIAELSYQDLEGEMLQHNLNPKAVKIVLGKLGKKSA